MSDPKQPDIAGKKIRAVICWGSEADGSRRALYLHEGDTVQLGRDADNNLVIDNAHISRHHAIIVWRENAFEISDLGSINGTRVNGKLISTPVALADDDSICLYKTKLDFNEAKNAALESEAGALTEKTFIVPIDAAQPHLIISAGNQEGRKIPLQIGKAVIGRATLKANWDIALQDRFVSRPQAQVEFRDGHYILSDLGSGNGTLVNGITIVEPKVLQDGDVILLGETTLLFRSGGLEGRQRPNERLG
jgi:pSer/pThr/pTyr-binding forkhead associated (FHA) protein